MEKEVTYNGVKLTKEEKKNLIDEIIYFFETERDEKLGIIASETILEFFMDNLGKHIYNRALDDMKGWFSHRMEDVEADFYSLYK